MNICENCLFQGDKAVDDKGASSSFCLIKADWLVKLDSCGLFKKNADIGKETKTAIAAQLRQEEAENRRLKKINRSNIKFVIVALIISFVLFLLTVKFFDKYIF